MCQESSGRGRVKPGVFAQFGVRDDGNHRPMDIEIRTDWLCERCNGVITDDIQCRCQQPHDPVATRRRHREAVQRARQTDAGGRHLREAA